MNQRQLKQLLEAGIVTEAQVERACASEAGSQGRLLEALLELGDVDSERLLQFLARIYKVPYLDVSRHTPPERLMKLVPEDIYRKLEFLPLDEPHQGPCFIAVADPQNHERLDAIRFRLGRRIKVVFTRPDVLRKRIEELLGEGKDLESSLSDLEQSGDFGQIEVEKQEDKNQNIEDLRRGAEHSPVIKLVNGILMKALSMGSSDIHIEPGERESVVRLRVDGRLRPVLKFPASAHKLVASRIKILSQLDISNTRTPQDGRTRVRMMGKQYDLRVSTLPSVHGEKVVLRILDKSALALDLDALGFQPEADKRVRRAISLPTGAVLVTGPTGSGKTTTLYSFLNHIHDEETNIITVEDPVEYQIRGINQVQMNPKAGLTFAAALRSILRQDPDVVMVGEIRDEETAEIAMHAAQTGHLVLSTLHTNDAPSTIHRLEEMGLEPALIAASVNLVVAQRLVRRLCPKCREQVTAKPEWCEQYGIPVETRFFRPKGCPHCMNNGYRGRVAIHEVMWLSDDLREMIARGASVRDLRDAARREGMLTLFEDGIAKALAGHTSLREVLRAANPPEGFRLADQLDDEGRLLSLAEARGRKNGSGERDGARTVMIVDDSSSVRNLTNFILGSGGFEVISVEDGQQAWQMMQQRKPDVVLTDYEMPNLSGPDLVKRIRSSSAFDDVAVVMLTSRKAEEDEVLGLEIGADDYIVKPIEPMKLLARVKKVLAMYDRIRNAARGGA